MKRRKKKEPEKGEWQSRQSRSPKKNSNHIDRDDIKKMMSLRKQDCCKLSLTRQKNTSWVQCAHQEWCGGLWFRNGAGLFSGKHVHMNLGGSPGQTLRGNPELQPLIELPVSLFAEGASGAKQCGWTHAEMRSSPFVGSLSAIVSVSPGASRLHVPRSRFLTCSIVFVWPLPVATMVAAMWEATITCDARLRGQHGQEAHASATAASWCGCAVCGVPSLGMAQAVRP